MQRRTRNTLNFTKSAIDNLTAPEGKREYWYDQKIPGLAICVTAAGSKSFYVLRRIGPKMEFIRIGGWPEVTVDQARTEAQKINGSVANGINPADRRRVDRQAETLGEAYEVYLELPTRTRSKRPRSPKTRHEYELQFKAYLNHWRDRRLGQISRADVEALHNKLGTENGHYVANRTLALLKAVYNAAIDSGYPGVNPAARVRKFEERSRERFLQADELPRFWKELQADPSEKVRDAILLLLFTGQRKSNVLAMRWEDVNLERQTWSIPITKSGRPHEVPLTAATLEVLQRRLESRLADGPADPEDKYKRLPSPYVLPGLHGHGHLKDIMKAWGAILERADLQNLRLHDLRRSLASWQTIGGTNAQTVGRMLGHSDPAATAIYSRLDLTAVRTSMETASSAILAAAKPKSKRNKKAD